MKMGEQSPQKQNRTEHFQSSFQWPHFKKPTLIPGHLAEIVGLAAVAPQSNLSPQVLGGRVGFGRGLLLIGDRLDHKG